MLNVAVIGCGISGRNLHIPCIKSSRKAKLVAVCDRDIDRLSKVKSPSHYEDAQAMLDDEDIDVVHIATPPGTHLPIMRDIISNCKNILIEKPVATSVDEVDEMIEIKNNLGGKYSVVHNQMFFPNVSKARKKVQSGSLGEVVSVYMLFGENRDLNDSERGGWVFELPGGEIGEGLPHQVYLPLSFTEGLGKIRNFDTYSMKENKYGFDRLSIDAVDESGTVDISIKIQTNSSFQNRLQIHCTEGMIETEINTRFYHENRLLDAGLVDVGTEIARFGLDYIKSNISVAGGVAKRKYEAVTGDGIGEAAIGHRNQIDRFYESVIQDEPVPVSLEESRDTIVVLEELKKNHSA